MKSRKETVSKMIYNILIPGLLIGFSVFFVMYTKQLQGLDGDFYAYTWGAKLSGIAESLNKYGELRLWNPNIWCGISGIHNFTDPFYPPAIFISKIFWNAETEALSISAYFFFALLHSILAVMGFYFLLKELGMNCMAGLLAVMTGTPLILINTTYMQICWIPMFGYFFLKAYKGRMLLNMYSILSGIVFGLFLLQELSQGAVMGVMLMGIFYFTAVYVGVCKRNIQSVKRITLLFLIVGITGVCIGAVNLFPILEQQKDLLRVTITGFEEADKGGGVEKFLCTSS